MVNMQQTNTDKNLASGGEICQPPHGNNIDNIDPIPKQCCDDQWPSQKWVPTQPPLDWRKPQSLYQLGLGQSGNCDPIQTGQLINDLDTPNRNVIYRYARGIRGCDEAMLDTFRQTMVIDDQGKAHVVDLIWASQEKAVDFLLQDNIRKGNSLVVDRIRLPIMAIWNNGISYDMTRFTYQKAYTLMPWLVKGNTCEIPPIACAGDPPNTMCEPACDPNLIPPTDVAGCKAGFTQQEKYPNDTYFGVTRGIPLNITYTLYIWTLYEEDMNQILESCISKFSPCAYLNIKGVWWEVIVTLDSLANNIDIEPGDAKVRVLKYQLNMTAKTYLPQPIYRFKEPKPQLCPLTDLNCFPPQQTPMPLMSDEEMQGQINELRKSLAELEQSISSK